MSEEKIMGFEEILGNEMVKDHFKKAIQNHKISHAYILTGEAGMGRKSIANAFAMTLLCEKGGSEPCMMCHSCKQVMSGNHPDLIYVTHEKPGSIGVDDVREQINDTIMIRPYSSYYKIYIVDEAEKNDGPGAECPVKNDRRAAVLRGHHSDHDEPGGVSSDDPLQMCPDEVKAA